MSDLTLPSDAVGSLSVPLFVAKGDPFFRLLVDQSIDMIVVLDERGVIRFMNGATKSILGFRPKELVGRWAFELVHEEDRPVALNALQNVLEAPGQEASAEFRYRHKNGSWKHLAAIGKNLLHEPQLGGIIVNLRDISQQHQTEAALRESEARFCQLTQNIQDVFWISAALGKAFHYVSPAYEQIWGRTCESLYDDPQSLIESLYPEDRQRLLDCWKQCVEGTPFTLEYRIVRDDGTIRWILDRGFPVYATDGKVYRCAGIAKDVTERRARDMQINRLTMAVQQSPAGVLITNPQGTIEFVNPKFTEMTGYTAAEAVGQSPSMLKSNEHPPEFYRKMWSTIAQGGVWRGEICNRKKDGSLYWESASISAVRNERNEIANYVAVKEDITDKVRDREQLRLQSSALAAAANSIFITDQQGHITWANAAFCKMSGYSLEELLDKTPRLLKSGRHDDEFYAKLWNTVSSGQVWSGELSERRKNGETFIVHQTITPLTNSHGEITHYIAVHEDITARKNAEARIQEMAYHDALTGLSNRVELQHRLERQVKLARRHSRSLALHFIDLDRFKVVNDTMGHAVGDQLLKSVAKRLKTCLRGSDTAARIGGDEFAVLQPEIENMEGVATLAQKIIAVMAEPFRLNGRDIRITPSIGISVFPLDSTEPEELLKNADMAMYLAKKEGRNNYQFFTSALNAQLRDRLALEVDLRAALQQRDFELYYQPQFDLRTLRITGLEALLRWKHPTRGFVPPSLFVDVAEECGLIHDLSRWVIERACSQNAQWQQAGLPRRRIAVNVSSANFKNGNLCETIAEVLERTGLPAEYLELEVTETLLLQDEYVIRAVPALKKLGIMLSIDDFGTGYSSLNYLRRLPVGKLKIDQSFVGGLPGSQDDAIISQAIIDLGHALGHTVIAEGIETEDQLNFLRKQGCNEGQGFFLGTPMPADRFREILESEQRLDSAAPSFG